MHALSGIIQFPLSVLAPPKQDHQTPSSKAFSPQGQDLSMIRHISQDYQKRLLCCLQIFSSSDALISCHMGEEFIFFTFSCSCTTCGLLSSSLVSWYSGSNMVQCGHVGIFLQRLYKWYSKLMSYLPFWFYFKKIIMVIAFVLLLAQHWCFIMNSAPSGMPHQFSTSFLSEQLDVVVILSVLAQKNALRENSALLQRRHLCLQMVWGMPDFLGFLNHHLGGPSVPFLCYSFLSSGFSTFLGRYLLHHSA